MPPRLRRLHPAVLPAAALVAATLAADTVVRSWAVTVLVAAVVVALLVATAGAVTEIAVEARARGRWESEDVLWVVAMFLVFPLAGAFWWLWGRRIRYRDGRPSGPA